MISLLWNACLRCLMNLPRSKLSGLYDQVHSLILLIDFLVESNVGYLVGRWGWRYRSCHCSIPFWTKSEQSKSYWWVIANYFNHNNACNRCFRVVECSKNRCPDYVVLKVQNEHDELMSMIWMMRLFTPPWLTITDGRTILIYYGSLLKKKWTGWHDMFYLRLWLWNVALKQ